MFFKEGTNSNNHPDNIYNHGGIGLVNIRVDGKENTTN